MEVHLFGVSFHVHSHEKLLPLERVNRRLTSLFKIHIFNAMWFLFQPDAAGSRAGGARLIFPPFLWNHRGLHGGRSAGPDQH